MRSKIFGGIRQATAGEMESGKRLRQAPIVASEASKASGPREAALDGQRTIRKPLPRG